MTALLASLRGALARGSACTAEHLGLYAAAAEGVAAETRDAVRGASAFVAAATQLATELPALEHLAEQTCARARAAQHALLSLHTSAPQHPPALSLGKTRKSRSRCKQLLTRRAPRRRQHVRAQLEALEAAAAKVLPPPPAPPRAGVAALFSRGGS